MGLKIAQINAQRSRGAAVNLELLINKLNVDILCVQEPYTHKGKVRGYTTPGLRVIEPKRENSSVAAVVRDSKMDVFQNSSLKTEHLQYFQVTTESESLYIVNVYCQYSMPISSMLNNLKLVLNKISGNQIIIMMDANAKSEWWFSKESDDREREVEEFIAAHRLRVVNEPNNPPTFMTTRRESNIDITLTSENLTRSVKDWKVDVACTTSDHNLILFNIVNQDKIKNTWTTQESYNMKRANWDKFKNLIESYFDEGTLRAIRTANANNAVHIFNIVLDKTCRGSILRRRLASKTVPWWTSDLAILRFKANRTKKQLIRARRLQLTDLDNYVKAYKAA
jgi:hypothetical protein